MEILSVIWACAMAGKRVTREEESLVPGMGKVKPIDGVFLSYH
jgi:hypothetical protein